MSMKKATTIEEQLEKFKSRGLKIDCSDNKAKEIISDIGYYRLGFYLFPFEKDYPNLKNRTHEYKEGSCFDDVVRLYYFDTDLRNTLLYYINRIEINFRTKMIYFCSNYFKDDTTWYVNENYVREDIVRKITDEYNNKFRKFSAIKNHHKNHPDDDFAPAWKTIEFVTFGNVFSLYSSLKDDGLKRQICSAYGVKYTTVFENYMTLVIALRNICAHSNMLYDYKLPKSIKNGPALTINVGNENKLYSAINVIKYILSSISNNRANDLIEDIDDLFNECKENDKVYAIINEIVK